MSLFEVFANSPRFLAKGVPNLLDDESPLSLRRREITILRLTARLNCEYEWGVHVAAFAKHAELSAAEIAATCQARSSADVWSKDDAVLVEAVDAFADGATLRPDLRLAFEEIFDLEQQLEIAALCGAYRTVCIVALLADLPPEPFAPRFPSEADQP